MRKSYTTSSTNHRQTTENHRNSYTHSYTNHTQIIQTRIRKNTDKQQKTSETHTQLFTSYTNHTHNHTQITVNTQSIIGYLLNIYKSYTKRTTHRTQITDTQQQLLEHQQNHTQKMHKPYTPSYTYHRHSTHNHSKSYKHLRHIIHKSYTTPYTNQRQSTDNRSKSYAIIHNTYINRTQRRTHIRDTRQNIIVYHTQSYTHHTQNIHTIIHTITDDQHNSIDKQGHLHKPYTTHTQIIQVTDNRQKVKEHH